MLKEELCLEKVQEIPELKATLFSYVHDSGLRLYWLKRPDINKTFAVAFKTIPSDSTGVFHIIEHSVLCGSKRFPAKEPFTDMLKSSLNTFLNAMTYPDRTIYPLSSRNEKDFLNLIEVYLDAVFAPLVMENPEAFYQEGWHYAINDNSVDYQGVVLNEMKSVDIDDIEYQELTRILFPDTVYAHCSGGDSLHIPDLDYKGLQDAYQKHYCLANATIILDGEIDLDKVLEKLEPYMKSKPGNRIGDSGLVQERPVNVKETVTYEINQGDREDLGRIVYGRIVANYDEEEKIIATNVLIDAICGHNEAPLKKAILDSGLAEDVGMYLLTGTRQAFLVLEIKNCDLAKEIELNELIDKTINNLTENLDHSQLAASLANYEFLTKEADFGTMPPGLIYALSILESTLYGGNPILKLEKDEYFKSIKAKLDTKYFEELLIDIWYRTAYKAELILKPDKDYGKKRRDAEGERITKETSNWSKEDYASYKDLDTAIKVWQRTEDTPEVKGTLPKLKLSDIEEEGEKLPIFVSGQEEATVLFHDVVTRDIIYVNMYFDISGLTVEDYSNLAILASLFAKIKTTKHSSEELVKELALVIGNLSFAVSAYQDLEDTSDAKPKLVVSFSCLRSNYERAKDLVLEIIKETAINEETSEDIARIIKQLIMSYKDGIVMKARSLANSRTLAQYSAVGVISDAVSGLTYYRHLQTIDKNEGAIDNLANARRWIDSQGLIISVTADAKVDVNDLIKAFDNRTKRGNHKIELKPKRNEAIVITSDGAATVLMTDFGKTYPYSGHALVGSKIISMEYLWNEVRRLGGAYGTGSSILVTNQFSLFSSSDPRPSQSLDAYRRAGDYLLAFDDISEIEANIVGTIADERPLLSPRLKGLIAARNYIIGLTDEKRREISKEILSTTKSDIDEFASAVIKGLKEATYCVVGSRKAIESLSDVEEIIEL